MGDHAQRGSAQNPESAASLPGRVPLALSPDLTWLRSQTPISQTASKPNFAIASHSVAGTEPKWMGRPILEPIEESHTHVLIS